MGVEGRGSSIGGLYVMRGEGVEVVGGTGGEGRVVDDDKDGGVVIFWMRGVVIVPLPFSSRGSWMSALHSMLVQHLLIYKKIKNQYFTSPLM